MSLQVFPIQAYDDNYIWCVHNQTHCIVVDPGDAAPVLAYCQAHQLQLIAILITHHHWDHTDGIDPLLNVYANIPVYGPHNPKIKQIRHRLNENDELTIAPLALTFKVLEVPGHTLDHIAYFSNMGLFCGDTLFSAGCGRLFEGTAKQMYQSTAKLAVLAADTKVYCTHEYTLSNINFALAVEPNNQALLDYKRWAQEQRTQQRPTLPSTIRQELLINPFLRCANPDIINRLKSQGKIQRSAEHQVFAALRSWKDSF